MSNLRIIEPSVFHDIPQGIVRGDGVKMYRKLFKDIKGIYRDSGSVSDDTVMYSVYSHEVGDATRVGNLFWGLTIMEPILVDGEYNMTRGHFHNDRNCAEYYICLGGTGLLLLMDGNRNTHAEKMYRNSLHHIDGSFAHRIINTGEDKFLVGACWPTTAGHDYEAIEKHPFPYRVFKRNGKITIEEC